MIDIHKTMAEPLYVQEPQGTINNNNDYQQEELYNTNFSNLATHTRRNSVLVYNTFNSITMAEPLYVQASQGK